MTAGTVYAIHWHQKQRNAHQADDLIWAPEGYREAVFKLLEIAEEHGVLPAEHGCFSEDDLDRLREIDVGPFVLRLLRSNEWYPAEFEYTDDPDESGALRFVLENSLDPDVEKRRVKLVELRYSDQPMIS